MSRSSFFSRSSSAFQVVIFRVFHLMGVEKNTNVLTCPIYMFFPDVFLSEMMNFSLFSIGKDTEFFINDSVYRTGFFRERVVLRGNKCKGNLGCLMKF